MIGMKDRFRGDNYLAIPEKCKACIWGPLPSDTHGEDSDLTCHFVGTCNNFDRFRKREG